MKKLKNMLSNKLKHIDFYNKDFMQFNMSNNKTIGKSNFNANTVLNLTEIKFYINQSSKIIRIVLKNYPETSKVVEDLVHIFKSLKKNTEAEILSFFRKKIMKIFKIVKSSLLI